MKLLIAFCLLASTTVAGPLSAAPVTPWPTGDCAGLATKLSKALKIPLQQSVGAASQDMVPPGTVCMLNGKTTGLGTKFDGALTALNTVMDGWDQDPAMSADGPGSAVQGFVRDHKRAVVSLETEPPAGTCQNAVVGACKVPRKRWTWTLAVSAYVQ